MQVEKLLLGSDGRFEHASFVDLLRVAKLHAGIWFAIVFGRLAALDRLLAEIARLAAALGARHVMTALGLEERRLAPAAQNQQRRRRPLLDEASHLCLVVFRKQKEIRKPKMNKEKQNKEEFKTCLSRLRRNACRSATASDTADTSRGSSSDTQRRARSRRRRSSCTDTKDSSSGSAARRRAAAPLERFRETWRRVSDRRCVATRLQKRTEE